EHFARNRSGNYARARTKPVNPKSERQQLVRTVLAYLTERWAETLTPEERDAWNAYAAGVAMKNKLGETIKLSGFNHYFRSNAYLCRRGETIVDAGPINNTLPEKDPDLYITTEVHEQRFNIHFNDALDWAKETGAWLWMLQGKPQNPQRYFFDGPYRGVKDKAGVDDTGISTPEQSTNLWVVGEGQKIWYQLRIQRVDGRISEPEYSTAPGSISQGVKASIIAEQPNKILSCITVIIVKNLCHFFCIVQFSFDS
ncbi:unnamed protein product, partial [marine sediment metagenome]